MKAPVSSPNEFLIIEQNVEVLVKSIESGYIPFEEDISHIVGFVHNPKVK